MPLLRRLVLGLKAALELGPGKMGLYALYQIELRSGYLARQTPPGQAVAEPVAAPAPALNYPLFQPSLEAIQPSPSTVEAAVAEADEITRGTVRLFGGPPVPLNLAPPLPLRHWTAYELGRARWGDDLDIKLVWEPARFGWACPLARAYHFTQDDAYPATFWRAFEAFQQANPANLGPNWGSGQEVALRLMMWVFAGQVFASAPSSTPARMAALASAIASHARRIPSTLIYARSQNNNHLLSEAAGLVTAGCALPALPEARTWRQVGLTWLNRAYQAQIASDGTYIQHSTNYHRLALTLALWVNALKSPDGAAPFLPLIRARLASATEWLVRLIDPRNGRAPNWGANDGAYFLPLAGGFNDYRPVAQACCRAFSGQPAFSPGEWDELGFWLGLPSQGLTGSFQTASLESQWANPPSASPASLVQVKSPVSAHGMGPESHATLVVSHFNDRPSHADQLAVDLWWRGLNVALDAGTFRYAAPPPWDNALAGTAVHNTVQVNGQEQMTHAGRFLWLDWAQATLLPAPGPHAVAAEHSGYRRLGVLHRRELAFDAKGHCHVTDQLLPSRMNPYRTPHTVRLHWLLPDWSWELYGATLAMQSPLGQIELAISGEGPDGHTLIPGAEMSVSLVRAGNPIYPAILIPQPAQLPILGWFSPTYNQKMPALSLSILVRSELPLTLASLWIFPHDG